MNIIQSMFKSFHDSKVPRKSSLHAFTLIELLVVVGIIVILSALFLPALSMAREQEEKSARCMSNLRQIGLVFSYYNNDFDEWFPQLRWRMYSDGNHRWWQEQLDIYYGSAISRFDTDGVFACPSKQHEEWWRRGYGAMLYGPLQGYQYPALPAGVRDWGNYPNHPMRLSQVRRAEQMVLVGDSTNNPYIKNSPSFWESTNFAGRHDGKANTLFVAGHVRSLPARTPPEGTSGLDGDDHDLVVWARNTDRSLRGGQFGELDF